MFNDCPSLFQGVESCLCRAEHITQVLYNYKFKYKCWWMASPGFRTHCLRCRCMRTADWIQIAAVRLLCSCRRASQQRAYRWSVVAACERRSAILQAAPRQRACMTTAAQRCSWKARRAECIRTIACIWRQRYSVNFSTANVMCLGNQVQQVAERNT